MLPVRRLIEKLNNPYSKFTPIARLQCTENWTPSYGQIELCNNVDIIYYKVQLTYFFVPCDYVRTF